MKIKNITEKFIWQHKVAEYLGYLAVAIIPLYVGANHFSVFNSPKVIIMMALSLLMTAFFLWGKWKSDEFKIKFSFLNITLLFFLLVLTASSIFGIDPINSFFGWRNTMPLVTMYAFAVFALILGSLIKKDKRIIINLLSVSFLTSIIVIIVFYTGLPGPGYMEDGSTIGNSSYLGEYILFNFFFGLGLFLYFKKAWKKVLVAIASLFIVINPLFINKAFLLGKVGISEVVHNPTMLLGIANGATMGIGLSILFICFLFMVFSKKRILKITGLVLTILLLLGIAFVGRQLVSPNTKLHEVFAEMKSNNRFLAWDIAKQGFIDRPIIGNGYNNYIYNFNKYYNPDLYKRGYLIERLTQPHNVVWEFSSNNGILGLIGYLGLLVVLFVALYNIKNKEEDKRLNNVRVVLAGILLGYFVQSLFVFDTVNTYLPLFMVIGIGLGFANSYEWNIGKKFVIVNKTLIILSILFCIFLMQVFVLAPWSKSKEMNKIMTKTQNMVEFAGIRTGLHEKSVFGGVADDNFQASKFFVLYQSSLYKIDEKNKAIFIRELDSMVESLDKDIEDQPNYSDSYATVSRFLNLRLLAEMKDGNTVRFDGKNYDSAIWEKSYSYLMKSIELSTDNPQSYLALSQLYMIKGDFDNAILSAKKSVELAPEYNDVYTFGHSLAKISRNKDFENYLNEMEAKWILK